MKTFIIGLLIGVFIVFFLILLIAFIIRHHKLEHDLKILTIGQKMLDNNNHFINMADDLIKCHDMLNDPNCNLLAVRLKILDIEKMRHEAVDTFLDLIIQLKEEI